MGTSPPLSLSSWWWRSGALESCLSRSCLLSTGNSHFLGLWSQSWCQEKWGHLNRRVWGDSLSHSACLPLHPLQCTSETRVNAFCEQKLCGGWGWAWLGGDGRAQEPCTSRQGLIGCQGFPSCLPSQAWSQIYFLSVSCGGIPRSYRQLVKRNHSGNCKLASKNCKGSFMESWCCKCYLTLNSFSGPTCWGSISLRFVSVQRRGPGQGLMVGILADVSQRWSWQKDFLDVSTSLIPDLSVVQ